jgi:hypothetical protein
MLETWFWVGFEIGFFTKGCRIYEFFFCGAPLIITGGTGSPLNPQAIK